METPKKEQKYSDDLKVVVCASERISLKLCPSVSLEINRTFYVPALEPERKRVNRIYKATHALLASDMKTQDAVDLLNRYATYASKLFNCLYAIRKNANGFMNAQCIEEREMMGLEIDARLKEYNELFPCRLIGLIKPDLDHLMLTFSGNKCEYTETLSRKAKDFTEKKNEEEMDVFIGHLRQASKDSVSKPLVPSPSKYWLFDSIQKEECPMQTMIPAMVLYMNPGFLYGDSPYPKLPGEWGCEVAKNILPNYVYFIRQIVLAMRLIISKVIGFKCPYHSNVDTVLPALILEYSLVI